MDAAYEATTQRSAVFLSTSNEQSKRKLGKQFHLSEHQKYKISRSKFNRRGGRFVDSKLQTTAERNYKAPNK